MEAFDLSAGLRVVGPGMAEADAAGIQGDFEHDSAGAAVAAGVDGAVVAQDASGIAVLGSDLLVAGVDVWALEDAAGGAGQA